MLYNPAGGGAEAVGLFNRVQPVKKTEILLLSQGFRVPESIPFLSPQSFVFLSHLPLPACFVLPPNMPSFLIPPYKHGINKIYLGHPEITPSRQCITISSRSPISASAQQASLKIAELFQSSMAHS